MLQAPRLLGKTRLLERLLAPLRADPGWRLVEIDLAALSDGERADPAALRRALVRRVLLGCGESAIASRNPVRRLPGGPSAWIRFTHGWIRAHGRPWRAKNSVQRRTPLPICFSTVFSVGVLRQAERPLAVRKPVMPDRKNETIR